MYIIDVSVCMLDVSSVGWMQTHAEYEYMWIECVLLMRVYVECPCTLNANTYRM